MKAPKKFVDDLKLCNPHCFPVWNFKEGRWYIFWRRGQEEARIVLCVENEDGTYRPLDIRTILWISSNVAWDLLYMYPKANDMYQYLKNKKDVTKKKTGEHREDYRKWWNKDHRTEWKKAYENLRSGIYWAPEPDKKKIIIT